MKTKMIWGLAIIVLLGSCKGENGKTQGKGQTAPSDSMVAVHVDYATGFSVRDSAGIRFVDIGKKDRFVNRAPIHDAKCGCPSSAPSV